MKNKKSIGLLVLTFLIWTGASGLPVGEKIGYQTSWGDEPAVSVMRVPTPENGKIFIHFRHTYQKPGTYQQTFTVSSKLFPAVSTTTSVTVTR